MKKKQKKKTFEEEKEKEEIIMEKGIFLQLDGHCPLGKGIEGSKRLNKTKFAWSRFQT